MSDELIDSKNTDLLSSINELDIQDTKNNDKVFCRRCGKLLNGIESVYLGLGPVCYKKMMKEKMDNMRLFYIDRK